MALIDGLVEYHKLDTDYSDATGNGNAASNVGTSISSGGIINSGADLGGTYIRSAVTPGSAGSISIWFKYSSFSDSMIIGNTTIGVSDWLRIRPYSNTDIQFTVKDENVYAVVSPLGTGWHHAVLSWDSSTTWNGYLDNVLVATGTTGKDPTNGNTIPFGVLGNGSGIWSSPFYFTGKIDEIGIWNRKISGAEVAELNNGGVALGYPFMPAALNTSLRYGYGF